MAAAGRKVRIKYDADGAGGTAAAVIAGARSDSVTIANERIDITDKDDAGVATALDDIGSQSFSMTCSGVMLDSTLLDLAIGATESAALHQFEIDIDSLKNLAGQFFIDSFEVTGEEGPSSMDFTVSLSSSGAITAT